MLDSGSYALKLKTHLEQTLSMTKQAMLNSHYILGLWAEIRGGKVPLTKPPHDMSDQHFNYFFTAPNFSQIYTS